MGVDCVTLPFDPLPSREGKSNEKDYFRTKQSRSFLDRIYRINRIYNLLPITDY